MQHRWSHSFCRWWRNYDGSYLITYPMSAVPIGALFGLGLETASQMLAWALAGTMGYGLFGALLIGVALSLGMVVTGSINGLVVRRMYLAATTMAIQGNRMMTLSVVGLAYVIGIIKLLQPASFALPISDMGLTIMVLGAVAGLYDSVDQSQMPGGVQREPCRVVNP